MFYKNYMFNYHQCVKNQIITILNRDMTNFKNDSREDGEFILSHTKGIIEVPTKEFENPYDYLEDGLFKGIIPPKLILQSIEEWKEIQKRGKEKAKRNILEEALYKKDEEYFKRLKIDSGYTLEVVLYLLNMLNKVRLENNLEPFDIKKEYKDYLIKYWGDFKVYE